MNTLVKCDSCGKPFDIVTAGIRITTSGDYEVQYVTCPHCISRFQIVTTDTELRELIGKHKRLADRIKLAKAKHFTPKTMAKYSKELDALTADQKKMAEALRDTGDDILKKI